MDIASITAVPDAVESIDGTFIKVGCAQEKAKIDPTGVGDSFRSGFVAGLAWGLSR